LLAQGVFKIGASLFDLATRREVWTSIMTDMMSGHVVVCGVGHVGYRVIEELTSLGEDVVAIEQTEEDSFVDVVREKGVPVHVGDARRDELLEKVGIRRAKAVVCATSNDLANLEIALDAKRMNPGVRVVMRMFDQRLAGKVGGALGLDQSFSTSALAAPLIAIQATYEGVRSAYRLDDVVRVTAEVKVGASRSEKAVGDLETDVPCRIITRRRASEEAFSSVRAKDVVREGDALIVDTAAVDLPKVRFMLGG
jgi:voltage-gated potassium channel